MVDASLNDQVTVGVLSLPMAGALQSDELHIREKVASWSTRAANSRSELVMVPCGLSKLIRADIMLAGHYIHHM